MAAASTAAARSAAGLLRTLCLCALLSAARANCRGLDRAALIKLYDALDGANWVNNRNWNTTTGTSAENKANDPCDPAKRWYGVGFIDPCERYLDDIVGSGPQTDYQVRVRGLGQGCFAGRITSLNLRRNNLRGNFSIPELGDLENITYVDLSWNSIGGAIPTEIGRWNNVQMINLAHNELGGELPTELGTLNSLGPAAVGGCGIDDPCPLGTQMKLTELSLSHNSLVGTIPSEVGALVHLKVLDVSNNNLTGTLPSGWAPPLGSFERLQVFYARENQISGTLPASLVSNMSNLRYMMLQHNRLSGSLPTTVGLLKQLSDLHAYDNALDQPLPDEIGDMTLLQDLRLQDNKITSTIPASIGNLTRLRYLDLYNNLMVGDVPAGIVRLTNLKELYLQNEHLTPVRQKFCRTRIPNVGKYSWRIMREEYRQWTSVTCDDMHDTDYQFNSLQHSSSYDATS